MLWPWLISALHDWMQDKMSQLPSLVPTSSPTLLS